MFIYTIGDVIEVTLLAIIFLIGLRITIRTVVIEMRCKHDKGVTETRACDAICRNCGKNLGFIGNLKSPSKEQK